MVQLREDDNPIRKKGNLPGSCVSSGKFLDVQCAELPHKQGHIFN